MRKRSQRRCKRDRGGALPYLEVVLFGILGHLLHLVGCGHHGCQPVFNLSQAHQLGHVPIKKGLQKHIMIMDGKQRWVHSHREHQLQARSSDVVDRCY